MTNFARVMIKRSKKTASLEEALREVSFHSSLSSDESGASFVISISTFQEFELKFLKLKSLCSCMVLRLDTSQAEKYLASKDLKRKEYDRMLNNYIRKHSKEMRKASALVASASDSVDWSEFKRLLLFGE